MTKPLNDFSGWLNFFWVGCLLSMAFSFLGVIGMAVTLFIFLFSFDLNIAIASAVSLLIFIILSFLYYRIVKMLEQKNVNNPNAIVSKLCKIIMVNLLGYVSYYFLAPLLKNESSELHFVLAEWRNLVITGISSMSMKRVLTNLLINIFWILYFFRSKRVAAYYGANATKLSLR